MVDHKPLKAITNETHGSSDEHDERQRKIHQSKPRRPTENLPHIIRGGEIIELNLRDIKRRFQRRRVLGEIEIGPRKRLNPNRGDENHPFP